MKLVNEEKIASMAIMDIEQMLICTNEDVLKFCDLKGWDIYDFIDEINDNR